MFKGIKKVKNKRLFKYWQLSRTKQVITSWNLTFLEANERKETNFCYTHPKNSLYER